MFHLFIWGSEISDPSKCVFHGHFRFERRRIKHEVFAQRRTRPLFTSTYIYGI